MYGAQQYQNRPDRGFEQDKPSSMGTTKGALADVNPPTTLPLRRLSSRIRRQAARFTEAILAVASEAVAVKHKTQDWSNQQQRRSKPPAVEKLTSMIFRRALEQLKTPCMLFVRVKTLRSEATSSPSYRGLHVVVRMGDEQYSLPISKHLNARVGFCLPVHHATAQPLLTAKPSVCVYKKQGCCREAVSGKSFGVNEKIPKRLSEVDETTGRFTKVYILRVSRSIELGVSCWWERLVDDRKVDLSSPAAAAPTSLRDKHDDCGEAVTASERSEKLRITSTSTVKTTSETINSSTMDSGFSTDCGEPGNGCSSDEVLHFEEE